MAAELIVLFVIVTMMILPALTLMAPRHLVKVILFVLFVQTLFLISFVRVGNWWMAGAFSVGIIAHSCLLTWLIKHDIVQKLKDSK